MSRHFLCWTSEAAACDRWAVVPDSAVHLSCQLSSHKTLFLNFIWITATLSQNLCFCVDLNLIYCTCWTKCASRGWILFVRFHWEHRMYYLDGGDVLHSCGNQGLQFRKTLGVNVFSELVNYIWKKDKQKENSALHISGERKTKQKTTTKQKTKNKPMCIWRKTKRKKYSLLYTSRKR